MAITVDIQDNPTNAHVGQTSTDATIIYSGFDDGLTSYNIERLDGQDPELTIDSPIDEQEPYLYASADRLEIVLNFRTWYRVRTSHQAAGGGDWTTSDWTTFKTRDKLYRTPDAITQLVINPVTGTTVLADGTTQIVVENNAKATVVETAEGATVTNTDLSFNDVESIEYTDRGATIVSKDA